MAGLLPDTSSLEPMWVLPPLELWSTGTYSSLTLMVTLWLPGNNLLPGLSAPHGLTSTLTPSQE